MLIASTLLAVSLQTIPARNHPRWLQRPGASTRDPQAAARLETIVVGTQRLHRCTLVVTGYCGRLTVPLNWRDRSDGTLSIRYQWIPASSAQPAGTIVAEEGGPGYATTGTADQYSALFRPLLADRNLLMMDQRGTGGSAPILCPTLQPWGGNGGPVPFALAVAQCGEQLNETFRKPGGGFVHASDLFGTSQSVRDLAALLAALQLSPVDFYGDSYGSFFGQVFASRYAQLVRSLVLDSTYPTIHQDPFDTAGQNEIRFAFDAVCKRSLTCSAAAPGSSLDRIADLGVSLDRKALVARTTTPLGNPLRVRVAGPDIETLLGIAGNDFGPYRNLDAAARAYTLHGDGVPLARLFAWSVVGGPAFIAYPYTEFSEGQYVADICTAYVNPFSLFAPIGERRRQYARAVADLPERFGFPLSNADVVTSPNEAYDSCITWPAPVHVDPIITKPPPLVPPTLPVLVISGDLDETTSPGDAHQAAAALGPSVRFVTFPNEIHVPALVDPYDCASRVVRQFIDHPLQVDTACTSRIPEVRTIGVFPRDLAEQMPAAPLNGNTATMQELRLAALAVEALGDSIQGARYAWSGFSPNCGSDYCGPGLRGGTFVASGDVTRVALHDYAYSTDASVSGTIGIGDASFTGNPGFVRALGISARAPRAGLGALLDIVYDERVPRAFVSISGTTLAGRRVVATFPAP